MLNATQSFCRETKLPTAIFRFPRAEQSIYIFSCSKQRLSQMSGYYYMRIYLGTENRIREIGITRDRINVGITGSQPTHELMACARARHASFLSAHHSLLHSFLCVIYFFIFVCLYAIFVFYFLVFFCLCSFFCCLYFLFLSLSSVYCFAILCYSSTNRPQINERN